MDDMDGGSDCDGDEDGGSPKKINCGEDSEDAEDEWLRLL